MSSINKFIHDIGSKAKFTKVSERDVEEFENEGLLIPGYPKGSDITIINCNYVGRRRDEYTQEIMSDYLFILFRDNVTGEKKTHYI